MASYRLSPLGETDLLGIATYTLNTWGQDQTVSYIDGLEACCQQLANMPELGRACDQVRPGLRRMEYGRHVLFYRVEAKGIVISRILHQRMLLERKSIDDEDSPPDN
jgi:toxin ParE1/3/4